MASGLVVLQRYSYATASWAARSEVPIVGSAVNSDDRRTKRKERGPQEGSSWWWKYKARRVAGLSQSVSGTYAFKVRVLEADTLVLDLSENVASQGGRERWFLRLGFFHFRKWCRENSRAPRSNVHLPSPSPPPSPSPSRVRRTGPSQTPWINRSLVKHENVHREPEAPFLSFGRG